MSWNNSIVLKSNLIVTVLLKVFLKNLSTSIRYLISFWVTISKFFSSEHIFEISSISSNSYSLIFIIVYLLKAASEKFFIKEVI